MLLHAKMRAFRKDENGSAAFEAIWVGLFLVFMIVPTLYLFEFSQVHMDGNWAQRTAARSDALNSANAVGSATGLGGCEIPLLPVTIDAGVNGGSLILCANRAISEPANNRFWKKLDDAAASDFPTILDDLKNEGEINVHYSNRTTLMTRQLEKGNGSGGTNMTNGTGALAPIQNLLDAALLAASPLAGLLDQPQAMAPSADYYRGDKEHWRKGHDAKIWANLNNRNKPLFPNVFPSALP